ncbi:SagB/ThcOx family dehydrogenase [Kibdelosporangium philippinense]|uniref:SagB/ThcOx family dehydrogenase n=1 Tax=Kibdelosporangium philippinense TaxID=211113 RepID=A0ABS8ZH34_9PSEU|nr:SagB family peptide dehydrogenase [Kibdelosporangium philippinense]MCE7006358.1 SagB/ThcOx family dehydrogenase [Kibdelosporangium philippinense]
MDDPRLRISSYGALLWQADQLIWHDTLTHRRFAVGQEADVVLRCFTTWQPLTTVRKHARDNDHAEYLVAITERMRAANILITWDSERHRAEEEHEAAWHRWGRLAALFHTETRNLRDQPFITPEEDEQRLRERLEHEPPPPASRELPSTLRVPLAADTAAMVRSDFLDVLSHRRSSRKFNGEDVSFEAISALLRWGGGITQLDERTQTAFKTSPSGGGRHPTEIYVHSHRVSGIDPGVYHLNTARNELEFLGPPQTPDALVQLLGDQDWVADSSCLMFFTSVLARSTWKYNTARTYRTLHLDVGHLSQTFYLLAAALGLGMTFTAAIRDERLEDLLGIDAAQELVMGCAVIGVGAV